MTYMQFRVLMAELRGSLAAIAEHSGEPEIRECAQDALDRNLLALNRIHNRPPAPVPARPDDDIPF